MISFFETERHSFLSIDLSNQGISRSIQQFGLGGPEDAGIRVTSASRVSKMASVRRLFS
jgi:hypothetical protein